MEFPKPEGALEFLVPGKDTSLTIEDYHDIHRSVAGVGLVAGFIVLLEKFSPFLVFPDHLVGNVLMKLHLALLFIVKNGDHLPLLNFLHCI